MTLGSYWRYLSHIDELRLLNRRDSKTKKGFRMMQNTAALLELWYTQREMECNIIDLVRQQYEFAVSSMNKTMQHDLYGHPKPVDGCRACWKEKQ